MGGLKIINWFLRKKFQKTVQILKNETSKKDRPDLKKMKLVKKTVQIQQMESKGPVKVERNIIYYP